MSRTRSRRAPRRHALPALAAALVLAALPPASSLAAQETGSLSGRVLSQEDLLPLAGVRVILQASGDRVVTDEDGSFAFSAVRAGDVVIRVEGDGLISLVESVPVAPQEATLVQFQLHRLAALLDELHVVAGRDPAADRRGHSEGEVRGGDGTARTAADLLIRSVPGLSLVRDGSAGGGVRVRLRGVSSITLTDQPSMFLDGVRIDDGIGAGGGGLGAAINVLDQIPASQVTRIRVLRGPAAASAYPNAAAGVILIETSRMERPGLGS